MTFHVVKLIAPAQPNCVRYDVYYIVSEDDSKLHRIGAYIVDSNFVEKWCHAVNSSLTSIEVIESEFIKVMRLAGYTLPDFTK